MGQLQTTTHAAVNHTTTPVITISRNVQPVSGVPPPKVVASPPDDAVLLPILVKSLKILPTDVRF